MPMDYSQLLATLIEESLENLADIDESLLTLDLNAIDLEKINQIFRAVHTIKGNSAIFKLESIGKLMHVVETFLDEVRKEKRNLKKKHIDILLQISDGVRSLFSDLQTKKPVNEILIESLINLFEKIKAEPEAEDRDHNTQFSKTNTLQDKEQTASKPPVLKPIHGWHISIHPKKDIFKRNLDPIGTFQMLHEQAKITKIRIVTNNLPAFQSFDVLECYLSWEIHLTGQISKEKILEILTWIFDAEDITITKVIKKHPDVTKVSSSTITSMDEKPLHAPATLRISTQKIDALMNAVGELVIIESMLKQSIKKIEPKQASILDEPLGLLETNFRYLQDTLLRIRMVPIAFAINRFPRMVFEMSSKMGKQVDFLIKGEQTEIDKNMIEKITDPLLHLIRNAIDHGIEPPGIRQKLGKNRTGSLQFIAYQEGDSISIEIQDDGAGIDPEKIRKTAVSQGLISQADKLTTEELYQFIFKPGFSTASQVTEISGRGFGLDVVDKNIRALGGSIQLDSTPGIGSNFKLRLPLTLAIMDCQLIRIGNQNYIVPLLSVIEMAQIDPEKVLAENHKQYYLFNDQKIPILILDTILHDEPSGIELENRFLIIVQTNGRPFGFVCDELLLQQPVVIKTLEENFCKVPGIVGATIMGDGDIGLILDVQEIVDIANQPDIQPIPTVDFFNRKFSLSYNADNADNQTNTISDNGSIDTIDAANEFLCFLLGNSEYAINMSIVKEINFWKKPVSLPFSPPYLAGVVNLRGSIIPVVDMRQFFNIKKGAKIQEKGILIIANLEKKGIQKTIGLIVDAITDTQSINKQEISPIPQAAHMVLNHYIQGLVYINNRLITLLQIQNMVECQS